MALDTLPNLEKRREVVMALGTLLLLEKCERGEHRLCHPSSSGKGERGVHCSRHPPSCRIKKGAEGMVIALDTFALLGNMERCGHGLGHPPSSGKREGHHGHRHPPSSGKSLDWP